MRFSFLVAVEFFFLSIICVGCDACRGIEDVAKDLKTFFLQNDNIIKREEFKCRKDSPSGLLLNANININGKINPEYKLLLCLEEFMYFFRSLFEDKIKVEQGEGELFYNFCKYVAKIIDTENIENGNKRERQYAVLFLNLCKLFFTDNRGKNSLETAYNLMEDVRDFLIVSEETFNIKKCGDSGNQEENLCVVFINCVWAFLGRFVGRENGKILVKKTLPDIQHTIIEDDLNKNTYLTKLRPELLKIDEQNSIIDSLFSAVQVVESLDNKNAVLPPKKKPKETFFLKNFSPAKVFFKKTKKQCRVLIYDDFVVFENTESKEENVWKRERKNRATPYSFYRLLSENEIREIDIFAKAGVIDILENEIKEQMLYDAEQLRRQVKEFILYFIDEQGIWERLLGYCKNEFNGNNELIEIFLDKNEGFEDFFNAYLEKIRDEELTEDLWSFSIKIRENFLGGIKDIFEKCYQKFYSGFKWFKGLKNVGNSCYINALSQNLFDYEDEMQDMVKDTFLLEMSQLQQSENFKRFSDRFVEITGHNGRQQDSHDLFMKIFIPKKIIKKSDIIEKSINSFIFYFDSKFKCLMASARKEGGGDEERSFHDDFNGANKKKEIKSIHDVLNSIYDYLNNHYSNLSLFYTIIDTYCDHKNDKEEDCKKKYVIEIYLCNDLEVDSYEVYNGLDLLSLLEGRWKEKIPLSCTYFHEEKNVDIYREQKYHNFSDFLVIHLKRFTNDNNAILNSIPIPDNICFDGDRYDITGIVCHFGGTSSGHYIAYKKKFGLWFKFDDSVVSVVGPSLSDVAVKYAYMLFLKKNKKIKEEDEEEEEEDDDEEEEEEDDDEEEEEEDDDAEEDEREKAGAEKTSKKAEAEKTSKKKEAEKKQKKK